VPDGIAAHWDLPQDVAGTLLPGGYHNEIIRCGDVVIRLEQREPASVAWEHELLAWLRPEVPEVVAPLPAKDGSTFLVLDGCIASVLPYVDGTPAEGTAAADVLARIHARGSAWPRLRERPGRPAYAALDWERNDWWDWSTVPSSPELVRARERTEAWLASEPALVRTPIHGDPAQQNFLARDGIVGVIDWEWARIDWPAIEVANAAWSFSEDDRVAFLDVYRAAGGPAELDVAVGVEARRVHLLANALSHYTLANGRPDRDWIDYLLRELRALP